MKDWTPVLRSLRMSDAADLKRNCFPDMPLAEVQDYVRWCLLQIQKGRMVRLVAEVDGQVVANGQLAVYHSRGEIGSLIVSPAYRRQGLGEALLSQLVAEARRKELQKLEIMASSDTPWLQAWYKRHGFSYQGEKTLPRDERVAVLCMSPCSFQD